MTSFLACSEELGEDPGDRFKAYSQKESNMHRFKGHDFASRSQEALNVHLANVHFDF